MVLDTNVLLSGLVSATAPPSELLGYWRQGRFRLLCCEEQLEEVRRVTRYPKIREHLAPAIAGRLVNELRGLAGMVEGLPSLDVPPDPWDNYLLALAQEGRADYLVSGDKSDLLSLGRHRETPIITVRQMLEKLGGSGS